MDRFVSFDCKFFVVISRVISDGKRAPKMRANAVKRAFVFGCSDFAVFVYQGLPDVRVFGFHCSAQVDFNVLAEQ